MSISRLCVIAPCFNEGEVAVRFVTELAQVLERTGVPSDILMVDDASTDDTRARLEAMRMDAGRVSLRVLGLPYNMGHQEAIQRGLQEAAKSDVDRFIVMDSDGEDDPLAILEAVKHADASIVLIARGKRRENLRFKIAYFFYKRLFKLVTNRSISFGNYSMIDRRVLQAVLDRGFTHYAAFLSKQKARVAMIVSDRRARIDGRSKMGFKSLSIHAFRSLIEYSEEVLALFLKAFFLLAVLSLITIGVILWLKAFTLKAIPGWASILGVSLLNCTLLCLGFFATGLLLSQSMARRDRANR